MNTDQIAAEAAEAYYKYEADAWDVYLGHRDKLQAIIKSAIEKALEYDDEKWRERERKFKLIVEKFGYPGAAHASIGQQTK